MLFKFTHYLKGIVIILLLIFPLFVVAQNRYEVTASSLNVRKLPSAESAIIGAVSKGTVVNVRELKTYWAEIDFKNGVGYVSTKYIQPVVEEQPQEPNIKVEEKEQVQVAEIQNVENNKFHAKSSKKVHFRLTTSLSLGLSNFYSPSAYSNPRFGFGLDAGGQFTADFLPKWMFMEATVGFMELGNSNYSFPSFSLNILPIGYRSNPVERLKNMKLYVVGGVSLQFPGGGIFFLQSPKVYYYSPKPNVNLYVKGGIEITDMVAIGVFYMHGLSNVCNNLPIGIKNSVFQVYCSFLFDKWKKK